MEVHCLQCKNCQYRYLWQYPSEMSNFFSWPLFTRLDDYQKNSSLSDHLISLVLIPGGFYYWEMRVAPWCTIARKQIWRSRKKSHAWQIATKRRNLMKLFAHWLDTQIQLWDQKIQKIQHRNPLKKGSLSENAMKEDERVLFQPFHAKGNRRGLRWEDFETSADLLALIVFEIQQFP